MYKSSLVQELLMSDHLCAGQIFTDPSEPVKPNASKSIGVKFFKFSIIANFVVS